MDSKKMAVELFDAFASGGKMKRIMPGSFRVKPGQMAIIGNLMTSKDPMTVTEISKRLKVAPPTISQMIADLERDDLVERIHGEQDRRTVYVSITPAGKKLLKEMKEMALIELQKLAEFLGESDCSEFCRILAKCGDYFSKEKKSND